MDQDKKKEKKSLVETLAGGQLSAGSPYYQTLIFLMRNPEAINILPPEDRVKATEIINRVQQSAINTRKQIPQQRIALRQFPEFPQFRQFPQRTFPEVKPMVDFNYTLSQEEKQSLDRWGKSIDDTLRIEQKYADKIIPIEKIGEKEWLQHVGEVREGKTPTTPFNIPGVTQAPTPTATPTPTIAQFPTATPIPQMSKFEQLPKIDLIPPIQDFVEKFVQNLPENVKPAARFAIPKIISALKGENILTPNVLAYALATMQHETAGSFDLSQEEIQGREQARRYGYSGGENYYGRGPIQLTHNYNYEKYGREIGMGDELVRNPDLAKDPDIAAKILARYFKDSGTADYANRGDFYNARSTVNSKDFSTYGTIARTAENIKRYIPENLSNLAQSVSSIWGKLNQPSQVYAQEGGGQTLGMSTMRIPTPSSILSGQTSASSASLSQSIYKPKPPPSSSGGGSSGGGGGGGGGGGSRPSGGGGGGSVRTYTAGPSGPGPSGVKMQVTSSGRATTVAPAKSGGSYYAAPGKQVPAAPKTFGGGSARGGKGATGGW